MSFDDRIQIDENFSLTGKPKPKPLPVPLPVPVPEPEQRPELGTLPKASLLAAVPLPIHRSGMMGGIAKGMFCSSIVAVLMNFGGIKAAVIYVCSLVIAVGGSDPTIDRHKKKLDEVLTKLEKKADEPLPKQPLIARLPTNLTEPLKETATKAVEPVKTAVDSTKQKVNTVTDKMTSTADKVANKFDQMGSNVSQKLEDRHDQAERMEREKLLSQASELGVETQEDMTTDQLRSQVRDAAVEQNRQKQEIYFEWWAKTGPNGRCPGCRTPMKVSLRGLGHVGCPNARCGLNSSSNQVRGQGAPPPPRHYPPAFILYWNRREAAQKAQKPPQPLKPDTDQMEPTPPETKPEPANEHSPFGKSH